MLLINPLMAIQLNNTNPLKRDLSTYWLIDVLNNGMTGNAFKLSTTLSMGWFWMRNNGCNVLYRGTNIEQIDFDNMIKVFDLDAANILPPDFCEHESDSSSYYLIRSFNKRGIAEQAVRAVVKVSLDSNGNIEISKPNSVFTLNAEVIADNKVRLNWFYCPLEQKSLPAYFKIYFDNGSGQIDYEHSIDEIEYEKCNVYQFVSQPLVPKSYLFVIKTVSIDGVESISSKQIKVQVANSNQ